MKIRNESKEFRISYDYADYIIPEGDMDIADNGFATFILNKARKWGLDVSKISESDQRVVKPIEKIEEVTIVPLKEEETKTKTTSKKKNEKSA